MNLIDCYNPLELLLYFVANSESYCHELLAKPQIFEMPMLAIYFLVFFLTIVLEYPIYYFFLRKTSLSFLKKTLWIFWINVATHPIVVFAFPFVFEKLGSSLGLSLLASEIFAFTVEFLLLTKILPHKNAFWASLIANLFSWTIGLQLLKLIF